LPEESVWAQAPIGEAQTLISPIGALLMASMTVPLILPPSCISASMLGVVAPALTETGSASCLVGLSS
jgi:hypothetical protein